MKQYLKGFFNAALLICLLSLLAFGLFGIIYLMNELLLLILKFHF